MTKRATHRLKIKRTVEQVVPLMDIDTTKVLSEEESDELRRQTRQRSEAVKLAHKVSRAELRDRLKRTVLKIGSCKADEDVPTSEPSS
jgi:hypothetical protein